MNEYSILKVLMERDGLTRDEALEVITEAKEQLNLYIDEGDIMAADEICGEFFGLEPDYIFDLMSYPPHC